MFVSFVSWILFAMGCLYNSNKNGKEKLVKNDNDKIDLNENI
jgi:hypothetical protein